MRLIVALLFATACSAWAQNANNWVDHGGDEPGSPAHIVIAAILGIAPVAWFSLSGRSPLFNWFHDHRGYAALAWWLTPVLFVFLAVDMFGYR